MARSRKRSRPRGSAAPAPAPSVESILLATIPKREVKWPTLLRRVNRALAPTGHHVSKRFRAGYRLENAETGAIVAPHVDVETLARTLGVIRPHEIVTGRPVVSRHA